MKAFGDRIRSSFILVLILALLPSYSYADPGVLAGKELTVKDLQTSAKESGESGSLLTKVGVIAGTSAVSSLASFGANSAVTAILGVTAGASVAAALASTGIGIGVLVVVGGITYYVYQKTKTRIMGIPSPIVAKLVESGEEINPKTGRLAIRLKKELGKACRAMGMEGGVDFEHTTFSTRQSDFMKDTLVAFDLKGKEQTYRSVPQFPHILVDKLVCLPELDPNTDEFGISQNPRVALQRTKSFHEKSQEVFDLLYQDEPAKKPKATTAE